MSSPSLALVTELVEWLRPLYESAGYVVVTLAMFLESAAFTGIVVPGDVILAVGGVYASNGTLSLPLVMGCGIVAALLGETVGFVLGRRYGMRLLSKISVLRRFEGRIERLRHSIERRGGTAIVLGRFATGVAGLVPFVAGTAGVNWRTFIAFTVPTTIVWVVAVTTLGNVVGNNIELIDRILSAIGWIGFTVVALALAGVWLIRRRRHRSTAAS